MPYSWKRRPPNAGISEKKIPGLFLDANELSEAINGHKQSHAKKM